MDSSALGRRASARGRLDGWAASLTTWTTLGAAFRGRDNSLNFVRLVLASLVIVDHAYPLSGRGKDPLLAVTNGQESFGGLAVAGFFAISGFLVTRSARRSSVPRYLWRRTLRIFPGFWVCLAFTSFVLAPVLWYVQTRSLDGFRSIVFPGSIEYFWRNAYLSIQRYGIPPLALDTPYGQEVQASVLNGSLWTLIFEFACYLAIASLAAVSILRRWRWVVALVAFGMWAWLAYWAITPGGIFAHHGPPAYLPIIGYIDLFFFVPLGSLFMLGAAAEMFREYVPINDLLGLGALALLIATLSMGGYFAVGYPALAYVCMWLGIRLPGVFRRLGARNDYSYGIYIYGWPVQQTLAVLGLWALPIALYIGLSLAGTFVLAFVSWHLVEKQALKLKDWTPGRPGTEAPHVDAPPAEHPELHHHPGIAAAQPPARSDEELETAAASLTTASQREPDLGRR